MSRKKVHGTREKSSDFVLAWGPVRVRYTFFCSLYLRDRSSHHSCKFDTILVHRTSLYSLIGAKYWPTAHACIRRIQGILGRRGFKYSFQGSMLRCGTRNECYDEPDKYTSAREFCSFR